jgi:hypothetical protein
MESEAARCFRHVEIKSIPIKTRREYLRGEGGQQRMTVDLWRGVKI